MEKKYFRIWICALCAWVLFLVFFVVGAVQDWDNWIRTDLNSLMWISNIAMWMALYYGLKNDYEKIKQNQQLGSYAICGEFINHLGKNLTPQEQQKINKLFKQFVEDTN